MNLSEIKFSVDTGPLKEAITVLGELRTATNAVTANTKARKESIQVEREEVKLLKEKEGLKQAELKTAEKAASVQQSATKSTKEASQVTEKVVEQLAASDKMLEKQTLSMKILRGETIQLGDATFTLGEGFTKSQANQLALMKMLGGTAEQMQMLSGSFREYNAITGLNTFDKSASGLSKLNKELQELNQIDSLVKEGLALTRDEVVNLARDLERLKQVYQSEGRTAKELAAAEAELKSGYVATTGILNARRQAAAQLEKQAKEAANAEIQAAADQAKANSYVEKELEKVRFALSEVNQEYNRGSANAILRFQKALEVSGMSLDQQRQKLEEFRIAQQKLQKAGGDRAVDYISRAIGPQITDIVVGLSTGQSPLMVLLQQGGQLRDQFAQMGVASADMAAVMRKSMIEMKDSVLGVGKAVGTFLITGLYDAGKAVSTGFVKSVRDAQIATNALRIEMLRGSEASAKYLEAVQMAPGALNSVSVGMAKVLAVPFAAGILASTTALIAFGIQIFKVIKAESELSQALNTTGAALGLSYDQATALSKSLIDLGVSQRVGTKVLTEMAKAGNLSAESFSAIAQAAVLMEKAGVEGIEELVKAYSRIGDDPVQALRKLNIETGKVKDSVIEQTQAFMNAGQAAKAEAIAVQEATRIKSEAFKQIREDMGLLKGLYTDIGVAFTEMMDKLWNFGGRDVSDEGLKKAKELLAAAESSDRPSQRVQVPKLKEEVEYIEQRLAAQKKDSEAKRIAAIREREQADALKDATKAREKANREYWTTLTLEEYQKKRFDQDYKTQNAKNVFSNDPIALTGKMKEYADEYEAARKRIDGPRGRDNALANLKTQFQSEMQVIKEQMNARMSILKSQRQAEFISEEEYRTQMMNAQISYYDASFQELDKSYKRQQSELAKQKAEAKGNARQLQNLTNIEKTLNQGYDNDKLKLRTEVFGEYVSSIYDAAKAVADYGRELKKIQKDEDNRRGDIQMDIDLMQAKTSMSDREFTAFAAQKKEELRVRRQLQELEDRKSFYQNNLSAASDRAASLRGDPAMLEEAQQAANSAREALAKFQAEYDATKAKIGTPENAGQTAATDALLERAKEMLIALDSNNKALDVGSALAAGFDDASNALGGLIGGLNQLITFQEKLNEIRADGNFKAEDEKKLQRAQISAYAKMAGETKKFFKEKTAGYKLLNNVEKFYHAQELAMTVKNTAEKLGLLDMEFWAKKANQAKELGLAILGQTQQTAATEAGFAARAVTYASEIMAKFTAMMGPYGLAAGAAVVAALGLGAFKSSGSFASYNTGTGTVLGDKSKGSASLGNSLERLKDINNLSLQTSSKMLKSLEAIEVNTSGLTTIIARSMNLEQQTANVPVGWDVSKSASLAVKAAPLGSNLPGMFIANALMGETINKWATKLFGQSTKIQGQGISANAQNLGSILSEGFQGQYFTDVQTKKKFAGFTRKTINTTQLSEMDAQAEDQITKIFSGIYDTIVAASSPLGFAFDNVSESLKNFVVDIGRVDTYGLTGEQIQERLTAVFSAAGDKIAEQAIPGLKEFQKVGEGYLETIVRVASGIEEATFYLDKLNITVADYNTLQQKQSDVAAELLRQSILSKEGTSGIAELIKIISGSVSDIYDAYKAFDDVRTVFQTLGVSGDAISVSLLKGTGGVEGLQQAVQAFQESFLSDSEKINIQSALMQKEFGKLGIAMPTTAEQFKNLVLSVDTTTESGKELLGRLLGLSEGFSVLADEAKRVQEERIGLEEEILKLQGNETELRRRTLESLDPSNRALQEQIWLLESQKKATEDAAKANEELIKSLQQAGKTIADEIKRLLGSTTSGSSAGLQAEFAIKTASARAGNLEALNALPELSKSLESLLVGRASSSVEAASIRASLAGSLEETLKALGISQDSSGGIQVGSSLQGSTSSTTTNGTLIVDNTNQELLTELKTLNAKVVDLEAAAVSTALSNAKIQRLLDRVAADGNSFSVVVNTDAGPVSVDQV